MFRLSTKLVPVAVAGTLMIAGPAGAQDAPAAMTRSDIEQIVREYLLENPEILVEVSRALTEKQQAEAQKDLFGSAEDAVLGNPDGSKTVVEFFDYNCGYCRQAYGEAQKAIAANPDLKIVLKEYPILGPDSEDAHIVAVALRRIAPGKYAEFHNNMYTTDGRATEEKAVEIATDLGVDEDELRAAMSEEETVQQLEKTQKLGRALQVNGTPTYFDENGPFGFDSLVSRTAPQEAQDG
ncbi:DsbA family protein [Notoacmeibacter ruber]|uniref:DsbA family protein n=1 Tax=Notoacmeibacter ruber TaxID=2670375 RepID=A0A3L7JAI8_9HYPH|nr:DsbA family protein [Notoacmeibacter ruber]RLQ87758.1 DsbA family protein [Notoacmeibacter ruber]